MREFGLTNIWLSWYKADASRCLGKQRKRIDFKPLTNKDLIGLWLILPAGYSLALVSFICEHLYSLLVSRKQFKGGAFNWYNCARHIALAFGLYIKDLPLECKSVFERIKNALYTKTPVISLKK